ncbi:UDP-2,4-diacetamido-2,4,6-trideoxy-beta-L-altropyranose hydrolase [Nautilia sp. PV-1]|uniref:UDP-2,4-diacetamido-2,4, 6-trideoxy-beta-L-altropyranose hydrolase n=1 Tax=Nautilia sp. PV-1 TaxID=2579250 RepID=UPI000FDCD411|nr:UDP-2,4-diacetamido-2,4,6-trideoxy-beta-L-altropyranose hydrolase [Nautilia sp. PV-1]AZV47274.1 UDP-2,4-diacetamido-2,4,6-trideoxy-beta-L-altropyranose hydrolase [Nautilia sp. PV-1]
MTVIRVDFSSNIGFGHLKRIENYINKYHIDNVLIICKECDQKFTDIPIIKVENENKFFEKVKELNPETVIIDNYNFTYENEKNFKKLFQNIKLVCFDDNYEKHFCDEIININLYAKPEKYKSKNPEFTKINIIKPLIREEFKKTKNKKYKKKGIFISLGATDAKGIGLRILKELKNRGEIVNFYTTSANKNINKLKRFCRLNKWCKLHIDEDVSIGMAKAEFGIITPSTITWEAIYMKMPFIAVKVAENQNLITKYLKQKRIKVLKENEIYKVSRFIP